MAPHHNTARQLTHELLDKLSHEEMVAVGLVLNELLAAKRAWPEWPKDLVYGAAVVAEEAGELVQATLNAHFKGTRRDLAKKEAEQTAVTAIRFISNFPVELPL
ncbi:MAG: hypothetical protein JNJ91_05135 [Flavobacteriales bacterium]|nr:hypothetical protein [Flavobacteriales bacterium]